MRLVILATAVSLFAAAASIACSAAAPPAADSSSDDTDATDSGTTTPVATATATATAVVADPDAGVVAIATTDASVVVPIGTGVIPVTTTPSVLCLPDSIQEFEPNNDVTTANVIQPVSSTYCGQVGPGDVDYVTVVMPTTFSGQLSFGFGVDGQDGPLNIQGFANGVPFSMGGGIPIGLGQPLTIQITSASGAAVDYRLRYTFQQF